MYARTVGGRTLSFGVSGMLWRDNLVMYDRQTDSWWAQASGEAIRGPMKGHRLEAQRADMMTWRQWKALHPDTSVLVGPGGSRRNTDRYASYHRSGLIGVTGRTSGGGGLDAKRRVLGFRVGDRAYAVAADALLASPVLQLDADGVRVALVATADRSSARAFLAETHEFDVMAVGTRVTLKDRATGSEWDGFEGRAVAGPLAGRALEPLPTFPSYWFSWRSFYPKTKILAR